ADSFGSKGHSGPGLIRLIGIGSDLEDAVLVCPVHHLRVLLVDRGFAGTQSPIKQNLQYLRRTSLNLAQEDFTRCPIYGNIVTLGDYISIDGTSGEVLLGQ